MRAAGVRDHVGAVPIARADAEDWGWNVVLPFVAYATILGGAIAMAASASGALYAPAAAVALLICVGIHNAWDVVTFLATGKVDALPDRPAIDVNAETSEGSVHEPV